MSYQKRIIQIFRTFIEKALIPQIKAVDGNLSTWNKFASMIITENPNFNDLQLFVDRLPYTTNFNASQKMEHQPVFSKRKEEVHMEPYSDTNATSSNFNPSKTFGGERSKNMMMQIKKDLDDNSGIKKEPPKEFLSPKEDSYKNKLNVQDTTNPYSNLEKLYKRLYENQEIIEKYSAQPTPYH